MTKILIDEATVTLALEALEGIHPGNMTPMAEEYWNKAIKALREALAEQPAQQEQEPTTTESNGGKTGWPPGLLQDDCKGLSKWLSNKPDAKRRVREALAEQPAQQEPVANGKLKVTLQDTPTEIELARYKRMFGAACVALGEINEALGLDPDDGGAEPIIEAITELKRGKT